MDKIRDALEGLVDGKKAGIFSVNIEASNQDELESKVEDAQERWAKAEEILQSQPPAKPEPRGDAQDVAWTKCRAERTPLQSGEPWTVGEEVNYRGFFNLGWDAALLASSQGQGDGVDTITSHDLAELIYDKYLSHEWGVMQASIAIDKLIAGSSRPQPSGPREARDIENLKALCQATIDGMHHTAQAGEAAMQSLNRLLSAQTQSSGLREACQMALDIGTAYPIGSPAHIDSNLERVLRAALAQADREAQG